MKAFIAIGLGAVALAGCTQVTGMTRATLHPHLDRWCAEAPREIRETARLSLGTTEEGNRILVECAVDYPDPKAPAPLPSPRNAM